MRTLKPFALPCLLALASACSKPAPGGASPGRLKAGFVYVGPVGDFGWSNAHDQARRALESRLSWLETAFVESVPEADAARIIDRLVSEQRCDIVFTTSFGFMDATLDAAAKHPDKTFMHCSGMRRAPNSGTYFIDLYQMYYLNGLMAGALSKTGKAGYVGAHPIPEVVRHVNAFAIGMREVNPRAAVSVKWLYSWYDPAKAKQAAEALLSEGCDALAFTEDSPAVIQAAEESTLKGRQVYAFGHYSPMERFGESSVVSGQLVDWTGLYEEILSRKRAGTWDNRDYLWLAREGAALLGGETGRPINPKFSEPLKGLFVKDPRLGRLSVYDLVMRRLDGMKSPSEPFEPFTGPLRDRSGALRLKAGERIQVPALLSMDWFAAGVAGDLPRK
jgi:simple sugar transport system substrate-binding protein